MKRQIQLSFVLFALMVSPPVWTQLIDNGDGTISDADQQIMWVKDAGASPIMVYPDAVNWANQLNVNAFAGYTDWRLPGGTDPRNDTTGHSDDGQNFYEARESEFGYLFYVHLSGKSGCHVSETGDQYGIGCSYPNTDPDLLLFDNIPSGNFANTVYFTGMPLPDGDHWTFAFNTGVYNDQPSGSTEPRRARVWAVRDAVIPIPQCNDGSDNDGDGLIDTADPGCFNAADDDETDVFACSDGIDNDDDGFVDLDDPNCCSTSDDDELAHYLPGDGDLPQCNDGLDNDDDCLIDYPDDNQCTATNDPSESLRCRWMFFRGWVCLAQIAWPIAYIAISVFALGAAYFAHRAWKRRHEK